MGIVNSGQKLSFPDICNMQGFTLDAFRERFTGVIDKDCCLDPVSIYSFLKKKDKKYIE